MKIGNRVFILYCLFFSLGIGEARHLFTFYQGFVLAVVFIGFISYLPTS